MARFLMGKAMAGLRTCTEWPYFGTTEFPTLRNTVFTVMGRGISWKDIKTIEQKNAYRKHKLGIFSLRQEKNVLTGKEELRIVHQETGLTVPKQSELTDLVEYFQCKFERKAAKELAMGISYKNKNQLHCPTCGTIATSLASLSAHLRIHRGERPHPCSVCNKRFNTAWELTQHLRIHTGEKPYSCKICGKKFTQRSNMRSHQILYETSVMEIPTQSQNFGDKSASHHAHRKKDQRELPLSCSVCFKRFRANSTLTDHMRTHTGEKPFACSICGKTFKRKGHVNAHQVTHMKV
ncbi:zinc finger protein 583-like [Lineus longissimus]|uniref:zinc finger protein 583-like n=1 Tax=Lineus longissimus TaxID=88925 RepID=UPI00315D0A76